jgi:hypothetical protein
VNVPEFDPALIVICAGTERMLLTFDSPTVAVPDGTLFVSVAVQMLELFGARLPGQETVDTDTATRFTDPPAVLLPYVAVMPAVWLVAIVAVLTVKVADVADPATGTEPGTVNAGALLFNVTVRPPVGAALLNVTVQVVELLGPRLPGLQETAETRTGATSPTVVLPVLAPTVAVSVALESLAMVLVVAVKPPDVAPASTVTEGGTCRVALLFEIVTAVPPEGAAKERTTVQVVEPFCPTLVGLQDIVGTIEGVTGLAVRVMVVLAEAEVLVMAVMVAL